MGNIWWWSIVCLLGSGAVVQLCQLLSSHIPCPEDCPDASQIRADTLQLITQLCGWLTGQLLPGAIDVVLKVTRWWWIPLAILWQVVSLAFEELRATCLVKLAL